jgi:hypothetical protein
MYSSSTALVVYQVFPIFFAESFFLRASKERYSAEYGVSDAASDIESHLRSPAGILSKSWFKGWFFSIRYAVSDDHQTNGVIIWTKAYEIRQFSVDNRYEISADTGLKDLHHAERFSSEKIPFAFGEQRGF